MRETWWERWRNIWESEPAFFLAMCLLVAGISLVSVIAIWIVIISISRL